MVGRWAGNMGYKQLLCWPLQGAVQHAALKLLEELLLAGI
jgi:hypothetical protein